MFSLSKLCDREAGAASIARLVCVYSVVGGGYAVVGGNCAPSAATAFAKCAPVLCLAYCTALKAKQGSSYAGRICLGLLLSALGDALLVWELVAAGMAAFAAAHAAYIAAYPRRPLLPARAAVLACIAVVVVCLLDPPPALRRLVPLYTLVLAAAAWRGGAGGAAAGGGALLFALSDTCLAFHMFNEPLPHAQLIIMGTYYAAQLLIALSALTRPLDHAASDHLKPQ